MMVDVLSILPNDAGSWVGLVGGLLGLASFWLSLWRRRIRVAVDYTQANDAHNEWHEFTVTNRSDLPTTFRYLGPAWFLATPLLPLFLNSAVEWDGDETPLSVLQPRASKTFIVMQESWAIPWPLERRKAAYLKVGFEFPLLGGVRWVKPRKPYYGETSLRERLIKRLYGLKYDDPL